MSAEYSVDQIRRAIAGMRVANPDELEVERMLSAYANRIEADESAVPVALLTIELDRWYVEGIRLEVEAMKVPAGVYPLFTHPPAQGAQVDRSVAIRLAQYGAEYAYRHYSWSIEPLQDGCEEHIDSWIAQASDTPTAEPVAQQGDSMERFRTGYRKLLLDGLRLIAGSNGSECSSPRAKAAELIELISTHPHSPEQPE